MIPQSGVRTMVITTPVQDNLRLGTVVRNEFIDESGVCIRYILSGAGLYNRRNRQGTGRETSDTTESGQ